MQLRELIAAPALGALERTGGVGLDVRVQWAQVVEDIEHADRLLGGELALTAGGWHRGAGDGERYAAALVARGAAALGFVPPAPAIIPADLLATCAERKLPLVELAPGLGCEHVAETTIELLLEHSGEARSLRRREQALAAATDAPGGFAALLDVLAEELGAPVWLVTGGAPFAPPAQPPLSDSDLLSIAVGRATERGAFELALERGAAVVVPLVEPDAPVRGRAPEVLACGAALAALRPLHARLALDQTLRFLALQRAAGVRERAVRSASSTAFMRRVGAGDMSSEELDGLLRALGVEPAGHVVGVAVEAPRAARGELGDIARALEDVADVLGAGRIVSATEHGTAALLFAGSVEDATDRALAQASLLLEHELLRLDAVLGTSAVIARHPSDVARALLEARQVARLNRLRGPQRPQPAAPAHDRSLAALLLARDPEASATLHTSVLGPLLAYDAEHGSELVRTLDVFLTHCGQWTASAHELGVHVNTLRYRLSRIEKITRRDLRSMAARVDLFAALRTRQLNVTPHRRG